MLFCSYVKPTLNRVYLILLSLDEAIHWWQYVERVSMTWRHHGGDRNSCISTWPSLLSCFHKKHINTNYEAVYTTVCGVSILICILDTPCCDRERIPGVSFKHIYLEYGSLFLPENPVAQFAVVTRGACKTHCFIQHGKTTFDVFVGWNIEMLHVIMRWQRDTTHIDDLFGLALTWLGSWLWRADLSYNGNYAPWTQTVNHLTDCHWAFEKKIKSEWQTIWEGDNLR